MGPHSSKIYKTVIFRQDMFQIGVSICRKRRCLLLYTIHSINHFLEVHILIKCLCPWSLFLTLSLICRNEASRVTGQRRKTTSSVELFRIQTHQPEEESSRTKKENAEYIKPCYVNQYWRWTNPNQFKRCIYFNSSAMLYVIPTFAKIFHNHPYL